MKSSLTLFDLLNDDDIAWMQNICLPHRITLGELIIDHNQLGGDLYIVLEGVCLVRSGDGKALGELTRGDLFGEVSFVDTKRTVARVSAGSAGLLARVPKLQLSERLTSNTAFSARFYLAVARILAYRLRQNLLLGFESTEDLLRDQREFKDEVDLEELDGTARAGSRLASLVSKMKQA